jgi:hypothetical protein
MELSVFASLGFPLNDLDSAEQTWLGSWFMLLQGEGRSMGKVIPDSRDQDELGARFTTLCR